MGKLGRAAFNPDKIDDKFIERVKKVFCRGFQLLKRFMRQPKIENKKIAKFEKKFKKIQNSKKN